MEQKIEETTVKINELYYAISLTQLKALDAALGEFSYKDAKKITGILSQLPGVQVIQKEESVIKDS